MCRSPFAFRQALIAIAGGLALAVGVAGSGVLAQGDPVFPLGPGPWVIDTYAPQTRVRVSVVARGIVHAWGMAFLPDGDILIAERRGTLRVVRNGVLDPTPIAGVPPVAEASSGGLMDIALHPRFETNRWVYFAYAKGGEPKPAGAQYYATTALARGRFDGKALTDVEDVFVADAWSTAPGGHGTRILFQGDNIIFFAQPHRREQDRAQNTTDHIGTILRLHDDGSTPSDNPFVGRAGYRPEIYSYGHRVIEGLALHPTTGRLWATEHGPQGGDELNLIEPGGNYGWPIATHGRDYDGRRLAPPVRAGTIAPELVWVPSIATSGLMVYTGDRFAGWRGHWFVGALQEARVPGTGHVQRLVFNENGEQRREALLREFRQRVRDVRQGPDGLIYVLTEEEDGALLRLEPAN
jgi:glucose/arabinose dehydrogenase